jgi:FkbM family methyltransferase
VRGAIRIAVQALWLLQVMSLADRLRDRLRILAVWIVLAVRRVRGGAGGRSLIVRWSGPSGELSAAVCDITDLWVLREVFFDHEYDVDLGAEPEVIVDLGANVGLSVLSFATRFPRARIIAVEASPSTFGRLERNVGALPQVTTVHAAVSGSDGTLPFYEGDGSWAASLHRGGDRAIVHEVPALTLETLLDRYGIEQVDLLKVDIEGAEGAVLRSPALIRVRTVIAELHADLLDEETLALLRAQERFEIQRLHGDTADCPVVTLRRVPVRH